MGTLRETLTKGTKGAPHLGPGRPRVYFDLTTEEKERHNADIRATNILLQGLLKDIYSLINYYTDANDIWDNMKMLMEGLELTKEDRESKLMKLNSKFVNNMLPEWGLSSTDNLIENLTNTLTLLTQSYKTYLLQTNNQLKTSSNPKNQATIQDGKVVVQNVQDQQNRGQGNNAWGAGATSYGGAQNRVGYANPEYFKDKMLLMQAQENRVTLDEEQLLFIASGQDNAVAEDVDEQPTMFMENLSSTDPVYDKAGPSYNLDILSEYVMDNAVPVVQSNVSSLLNDAYMMILNDMHEQPAQHVSITTRNNVVDKSLTAELATYKEQVELYERQARFELTKREQKIDEQLRIVITYRNIKEEKLKKELHSVKMQLASTINHNKSMLEEVASLKKDFKQKENKYFEEFFDMKALKEKRKVAIGYKSPLCLSRAKQVQPALYNGHKIIKTDHVPTIVHNLEDTLEIAEITRKKINEKMKTPLWTHNKINIRPLDYSKENFLATFTPQTQLTLEHIFWSKDVLKKKIEALKEQAKVARPVKALTMYPPNTPVKLVPKETHSEADRTLDFRALDFHITQNNRKVHLDYLKHLKENIETLREIVEEANVERPLERSLASSCLYTKHSQELLEYVIDTCLKDFNKQDKKQATTPLTRKKQVTFVDQYEKSNNNTHKHVEQQPT
nr:hypothetical protein [Tanacetum cinerariifolium]